MYFLLEENVSYLGYIDFFVFDESSNIKTFCVIKDIT